MVIRMYTQMDVILISSDHSQPYRLSSPKLAFNRYNLNGSQFAGEVPPYDMMKLLIGEWG